jgi:HD-like signal output (HDOD) protein
MSTLTDASPDETAHRILVCAAEIGALGAGRASLAAILARLCDPMSSAEEIARIIAQEPGLAARVLRVANSAYYGASGSVATLERAFVLLGVDAVRGIAAAACLDRAAARAMRSSPIDLRSLLRHSIATAAAAEALARLVSPRVASEAFIAGLLHDFGVTVQVQLDPAAFARLASAVQSEPSTALDLLEHRVECIGHERCAAVVFEAWNLPQGLIGAIRHHHSPSGSPGSGDTVARAVHLANRLAISLGFADALEPGPAEIDDALLAEFGIPRAQLEPVATTLPDRVSDLLHVLA